MLQEITQERVNKEKNQEVKGNAGQRARSRKIGQARNRKIKEGRKEGSQAGLISC